MNLTNCHCLFRRFHALRCRLTVLLLLFAVMLFSGCAMGQVKSMGGEAAAILPMPGATVQLGKITCESGRQLDFDPALLLNDALTKTLKEDQLLWLGADPSVPHLLFDARIVNYEPGNAFKRWVLPGWGSTLLEVSGELRTPRDGVVVAVLENKRSVVAGGAYTIGAWKTIFYNVADDLVQEIKTRINGGGFLVSLTPYAELPVETVKAEKPLEVRISKLTDARADKLRIGERTAAFGVRMGDIYPNRRLLEYLTETLSDNLRAAGHKVGSSDSGMTINGELLKFWVETPATMLYWDVSAEIGFKLVVKKSGQEAGIVRLYTAKKNERTYAWPSAALIEKVVNASVTDIMRQIQTDSIWDSLATSTATR